MKPIRYRLVMVEVKVPIFLCPECKSEFERDPHAVGRGRKYCSKECSAAVISRNAVEHVRAYRKRLKRGKAP